MKQLSLLLPGELVRHRYSGEVLVIAQDQTPIRSLEWLYADGDVLNVERGHGVLPVYRWALLAVESGGAS